MPTKPDAEIMIIKAETILLVIIYFTVEILFDRPTPRIDEVITCVVFTGIPIDVASSITAADEVSAATL